MKRFTNSDSVKVYTKYSIIIARLPNLMTHFELPDCQSSSWGHLERRCDRITPDPHAVRYRSGGTSCISRNPCQSRSARWKKPSESCRYRRNCIHSQETSVLWPNAIFHQSWKIYSSILYKKRRRPVIISCWLRCHWKYSYRIG